MKSKIMTMGVAGLALAASAFLVTPSAWATANTSNKVATVSVSPSAHFTFMRGIDNNIWYTLTSSIGSIKAATGNANNPFDISGVSFLANGFVTSGTGFCSSNPAIGSVNNAATNVGVCSGNWVKIPGAGSFTDGPHASLFGPIAATASGAGQGIGGASTVGALFPFLPSSRAMLINILAPGLGGNIFYTLFDATGTTASATSMNGGANAAGLLPASDPFASAGEKNDTGWVDPTPTTGFEAVCGTLGSLSRTCFGVWAPYPL